MEIFQTCFSSSRYPIYLDALGCTKLVDQYCELFQAHTSVPKNNITCVRPPSCIISGVGECTMHLELNMERMESKGTSDAVQRGQTQSVLATPKCKRKDIRPLVTFEEILADDIRMDEHRLDQRNRDHEPNDIIIGMRQHKAARSNFLGPILKKRFHGDRCTN